MSLAGTLPCTFFDQFLGLNLTIEHLSLPDFFGVPPGPGEVPLMAASHLILLGAGPGLAVSFAPGCFRR